MTKLGINWVGPEINEIAAYDDPVPAGFTITSTPTPPHGTYWLTFDGNTAILDIGAGTSRSNKARYWILARGYRLETTPSAGDHGGGISIGLRAINWVGQSDGTYKIELRKSANTLLATSSSSWAINTTQDIRWTFDGTDIIVEVNGGEEIRVADAYTPSAESLIRLNSSFIAAPTAGRTTKLNRIFFLAGDSDSDRPDTNVVVIKLAPDGNGNYNTWEDTACVSANSADYTLWDDYAGTGTHNDATDYNCGKSTSDKQSSTCTTGTISDFVGGIKTYVRGSANIGSKTVNIGHFWREGGSDSTQIGSAWASTSWSNVVLSPLSTTDDPPSGVPWTQAKVDALEIGAASSAGNDANALLTAVAGELVSVGDDPMPVPDGVALGSASPGVY